MPQIRFSLVIPFRNEQENLPALLGSLSKLDYPPDLYEVLFINDGSKDASEEIIKRAMGNIDISIKIFPNKRLSDSPKKDAISEGIKLSTYNWIVTTDADCEFSRDWLKALDGFIQSGSKKGNTEEPKMICGPVLYKSDNRFVHDFQNMDGLSLQAVTVGSFGLERPILCNGANLAYRKDAFYAVNGFIGNDHIASGDDIFLLEKMTKAFPGGVRFLKSKEAIVLTKPQPTWRDVIAQRIRWASKIDQQKNPYSLFLGILVAAVNLAFLLIPFAMLFDFPNSPFYLFLFLLKIFSDYLLILKSAKFYGKPIPFLEFPPFPIAYSIVVILVFFKGLGGKYTWKDRNFSKSKLT